MQNKASNFKFSTIIDEYKRYKILEISKNLEKFTLDEFKRLDDLKFFTFFGKVDDNFLSQYLFIETSIFDSQLDLFKKSFPGIYVKVLSSESGKKLCSLQTSIEDKVKEDLIKDVKVDQLYKVIRDDLYGIIVELKEFNKEKCKCRAFAFNKEIDLEIEPQFLEISQVDYEVFRYSDNFIRFDYLEGSKKYLIIDGVYLILWSMINYPSKYNSKTEDYIGGFFGFYFTLLKLKQLYPDFKFIMVFGSINDIENYYYNLSNLSNFKNYNLKDRIIFNMKECIDLCKSIGLEIYSSFKYQTREIIKSLLGKIKNSETLVYSRDTSYYQFLSKNISIYLNKISINGYDEILTEEEVKSTYKIKSISQINNVFSFRNSNFLHLKQIPEPYFIYLCNLLKTFSFEEAVNYVRASVNFIKFIEKEYNENLKFFKFSDVDLKSVEIEYIPPSQDSLISVLSRNNMNKEISIIDYIYPLLTSKI